MQKQIIIAAIALVVVVAAAFFGTKIFGKRKLAPTAGLTIEVIKEGSGQEIQKGQLARVHYTGWLENGTKFDSSVDRNEPFEFRVGEHQVIKGWDLGVNGMKVGEKRSLKIAPELAYGPTGAGNVIPPNSTLKFDVELLAIGE